ncbi:MAG: dihydrodipicolinate synthase family protein [Edaphobacter sp.]|uniref:dihydrodipicolinate synthase family protein n=1 Tax=Edaphobacter sp. TaxID=1934404 RepID=UPI0023855288|nr:dihydrodipicolinate synthase family protein [Edaphobacter sp.]MDE1177240.1 dihydrodipicolinate synthase family protein [Edaphobacter sp.]
MEIRLPLDGGLSSYRLNEEGPLPVVAGGPPRSRVAYAAAHVVVDPLEPQRLDMEATMAFRRHLWSLGFGVAEAMDTSQRGMGLNWETARELIRVSASERGGAIACGANTDQLDPTCEPTVDKVIRAYEEQCEAIENAGGRVILMASRALVRCAKSPEDYVRVYTRLLSGLKQPAILHWLGEAFDPQLRGYWGSADVDQAMDTCLGIIQANHAKVDGVKISLLDKRQEIIMRRQLPVGVRMYTGDDFDYAELIRGDEQGHSDALLGIFDGIAPAAALALRALDAGDMTAFERLLTPTVPLSRHIFQTPTFHYKTGLVFLAYLNGHQRHFVMLGGQQSARSVVHLAQLFVLADQARLLADPELAVKRMRPVLEIAGVAS